MREKIKKILCVTIRMSGIHIRSAHFSKLAKKPLVLL